MKNKILISYFYQVRNFPNHYIPISTAMWDPKWFHLFNDKNSIFIHKSGVVYGLRIKNFPTSDIDCGCGPNCTNSPKQCNFLKDYKKYLQSLNFENFIEEIYDISKKHNPSNNKNFIPVLIVYEKPDNLCSERIPLKEWFKENGYDLEEFDKNKI